MYVLTPGSVIRKQGRRIRIVRGGVVDSVPAMQITSVILGSGVQLTLPSMRLLLQHKIPITILNRSLRLLGRITPSTSRLSNRRLRQYQAITNCDRRLALIRLTVKAKIEAMIRAINRHGKNYSIDELRPIRTQLKGYLAEVRICMSIERMRGIEGAASALYWRAWRSMLRCPLVFERRTIRPPMDPINAMLSFGYALLVHEVTNHIEAEGLDPYMGFYHEPKNRRPSLALDIMEPMRHIIVDQLVLKSVNLGKFKDSDFRPGPNGGVWLTVAAGQRFARLFSQHRRKTTSTDADPLVNWMSQLSGIILSTAGCSNESDLERPEVRHAK